MYSSKIYDILIESLLVLLLAFTPLAYGAVHPWSIALFEIIAALMAMLWIFKMLPNGRLEFVRNPITPCIFLFIGYVFLQYFLSQYPILNTQYSIRSIYPWSTKTELLKIISYAMIFLVTLNTIKTKRQITRILSVIITVGFSMSIFYLIRYFGAPAPRGFINPDHFSAYLGMIIPLSLGFLLVPSLNFDSQHTTYHGPWTMDHRQILLLFSILMTSAALFFTMSRGGMFSFIAALLFIALLVSTRRSIKKKSWIILAIAVFIILVIAWLGATPVVERILSFKAEIASRYYGGRLPIWQGTIGIIKDNFIFGTGLGTFNYIFPKYQPVGIIAKHYTYAHSDFLELLSETGIIGFSLTVVCGLWTAFYLFRRFNQRHDPWVVGISLCVFGSLASIFIHSFTDFNLHIPANAVLLTILLSLLISIFNTTKCEASPQGDHQPWTMDHGQTISYPIALLAAGLLVIYTVAAICSAMADYYANKKETVPAGDRFLFTAIRLDPSNAKYHYELGRLYGKSKTYELQLAEYQSAVRLNPTNSQYHQSLAWAYGQKDISEAHQEFKTAIELSPNYYYPYQVYAIWLFNYPTKENIEKGVVTYKKAITLNPALAKEALDRYRAYQNDYTQLLNILPGTKRSDAIFLRYLLAEENIDYAIQFAERFLKSYKENAECFFWIADKASYNKTYEWDFIKAYYLKALELDPNNAFYRYWYAVDLAHRKDRIEADKQFNLITQSHTEYSKEIKDFRLKNYK
jgi:O-antigen ligase